MTAIDQHGSSVQIVDTDVLVIGFGAAGGVSAIETFDNGSDVIIIEKQKEENYYSNTRMSGGGFHSPRPSADRNALKEYALAMFSGNNLERKLEGEQPLSIAENLAEKWADYAPHNLEWMQSLDPEFDAIERQGTSFSDAAFADFPGAEQSQYRVVRSTYSGEINNKNRCQRDDPKNKKESGEAFYTCLKHGVDTREIDVHWNTEAVKFDTDDEDEVCGLVAENSNGAIYYRADSFIITTGGFEYNKNLRKNFLEGPGVKGWAFYGSPANTGDGITMAMDVGANLSKVNKAAARLITAVPTQDQDLKVGLRTPVVGRPNAVVVDNFGNRYASERSITQDPTRYFFYKKAVGFDIEEMIYPRVPSWLIFDESLRERRPVVGMRSAGYHGIEWGERNEKAIDNNWILKAPTVKELASEISEHADNRSLMEPGTLEDTICLYNEFCAKGVDESFDTDPSNMGPINDPPFYALPLYMGGPNTKGGISTNAEREVLSKEGNPIPNLFSAGEISSVFKFVYQGGGNLAEAIVFGRVAGENAAKNSRVSNISSPN